MDLGAGVKSFTTKSTTSYFTHLNHAKPDSLNCNRATSYAQFRPHRNPSRRASLRVKSSSTESISKVNVMPADDYALDLELSSLAALCPLDGRYWSKVKDLAPFMSEFGLIKYRVLVEIKWLLKLSQISGVAEVPRFSRESESYLQNIIDQFNLDDALEVKKIEKVNEASLNADLNQSWEVLAEPIQTVMRRYGVPEPYEKLKELTRGRSVTRESIREFIEGLDIPIQAMKGLLDLTPHTYIGEAAGLAKNANLLRSSVNGARLS